ncbi:MAG: VCBS repeat-containing protein, partial [Deltaproteobacteria bacterium]|nr:VCBS repeat-containing protein [Deltaproteobacteria bacterium]
AAGDLRRDAGGGDLGPADAAAGDLRRDAGGGDLGPADTAAGDLRRDAGGGDPGPADAGGADTAPGDLGALDREPQDAALSCEVHNECGGCEDLGARLGAPCHRCGTYVCLNENELMCVEPPVCCIDADGDGFGVGLDCAVADCDDDVARCGARCYPGASEMCDGFDNDCNTVIDDPVDCTDCYDFAYSSVLSQSGAREIELADIDGDGDLDIVYTNGGALGDLDNDGDLDRVSTGWSTPSSIELNDGSGHFTQLMTIPPSHYASYAAIGDVDGDGFADVLTGRGCSGNCTGSTYVCINDQTGRCSVTQQISSSGTSIVVADITGDGIADYVPARGDVFHGVQGQAMVSAGYTLGTNFNVVAGGDLEPDGDIDIVGSDYYGHIDIFFNDGSGSLQRGGGISSGVDMVEGLVLATADGDCDLDLLVFPDMLDSLQNVALYVNTAASGFVQHIFAPVFSNGVDCYDAEIGDLSGDGIPDIALSIWDGSVGPEGEVRVYVNSGL